MCKCVKVYAALQPWGSRKALANPGMCSSRVSPERIPPAPGSAGHRIPVLRDTVVSVSRREHGQAPRAGRDRSRWDAIRDPGEFPRSEPLPQIRLILQRRWEGAGMGRQVQRRRLRRLGGARVQAPLPAALNMTSASSFQMLRGSVIIFTGLLSVAFLGRRLELSQWLGLLVTIVGLVVGGLADLRGTHEEKRQLSQVITGDLLIVMAQVIVAIQMVLEEKFVYKHDVHPLRAVGTEGFFGFVILALLLVPMSYIPAGGWSGTPRPAPGLSELLENPVCGDTSPWAPGTRALAPRAP
ncbi:PREDICTED: solute carrier family 35 member F6 [Tinamus guttatus]|uniref:solute carrier family 35 member F6 n=1 Tax=Tinamus guttatus TaxID=94827 RepID=UPI00052E9344|nr:PREDICTED: solute carrier family 35 member F6 [Tinamus guttatus]